MVNLINPIQIEKYIFQNRKMSISQSKLTLQLNKELKRCEHNVYSQEKLAELYNVTSKIQPKNLMLSEFLTMLIEKNLLKNSHQIYSFAQKFYEVRGKRLDQDSSSMNKENNQKEQQKFDFNKFVKLLKNIAKMLYPGHSKAFEQTLFTKLVLPDTEQNRLKVDDNVKKYLTQEVVNSLSTYRKELQLLFETYMPQNFNSKLDFSWNEIRLLQKKLPIICLFRILFEAQIIPNVVTIVQFIEIVSKMLPAHNSNHKQVMFYYVDTFNTYTKENIYAKQIKLLQGDIGLTFFQFQIILMKIATQFCKENKFDYEKYFQKFMNQIGITQIIKNKKDTFKMNKLQSTILHYLKENDKKHPRNGSKKRKISEKQNKRLQGLLDVSNQEQNFENQPFLKLQQQSILITKNDIVNVRKILEDELPPMPEKSQVDKQNDGYFNIDQKHVVIGQQLPKLQQKNKPSVKPNPKQKKQDPFLGFKPQMQKSDKEKPNLPLNRKKKLRLNTQYPVILSEIFYPTSFEDTKLLQLQQKVQVLIQTTYIHLGQRLYEEAYLNYQKAMRLCEKQLKNTKVDRKISGLRYYLTILQAQIFEAAGKDQVSLVKFFEAKEKSTNLPLAQVSARAFSYMGLAISFYHLQDYEFSLRCMLKAKEVYGKNLSIESLQYAVLMNNMASCYMMLNRNKQAAKYFTISHQVLDLVVGRFDERTLVAQQNIAKNKRAFMDMMPTFPTMWKTYVEKSNSLSAVKTNKKVKK